MRPAFSVKNNCKNRLKIGSSHIHIHTGTQWGGQTYSYVPSPLSWSSSSQTGEDAKQERHSWYKTELRKTMIRKPAVAGEEGETKNCTSLQRTHWSLSPIVTVSTHSRKQLTRHLLTPKIALFRSCRAHKRSGFEGDTFKQRRRLVDPRVSLS